MTRLLVSDRLARIRRHLDPERGAVHFLILTESAAANQIRSYLQTRRGTEEIPRGDWALQRSEAFGDAYIEFIAALNQRHDTFLWKAMPFTNKNPLSTALCQDIRAFLMIVEIAGHHPGTLVVVTNSKALAGQLKRWGHREGLSVICAVKGHRVARRLVATYTPAAVVYAFIRSLLVWWLARRHRIGPGGTEPVDVVTTAFPPSSVGPQGWREAYFGPLRDYLNRIGRRVILLAVFFERPVSTLRAIQRLKPHVTVVPVEACVSLGDLAGCLIDSLAQWTRKPPLHGTAEINGLDVTPLVQEAIRDSCRSTSLFIHLCIHRGAVRLAQRLAIERWFYPYENRAWEKMILTAVRTASPRIRCIGYQHATITPSHFNLFLGRHESLVTPLPDTILTVGEVVHNRLERLGNYPTGLLRLGCALRQHHAMTNGPARRWPARISRVLVALASSAQEYRHVYAFLRAACAGSTGYEVRIRPHPEFTLEEVLGSLPTVGDRFFTVSRGPLAEELDWAHVVVYASSTVSVEALSFGLPVVHLELGELLSTDPLFDWQGQLKWAVTKPEELSTVFGWITAIPEPQFRQGQEAAQAYARRYLRPVTEERLKEFAEA